MGNMTANLLLTPAVKTKSKISQPTLFVKVITSIY